MEQAHCSVITCLPSCRARLSPSERVWVRNWCLTPLACPKTTAVCVSPWTACSLPGSEIANSPWAEGSRLSVSSIHFHTTLISAEGGSSFSTVNHCSCVCAYQVYGRLVTIPEAKTGWCL